MALHLGRKVWPLPVLSLTLSLIGCGNPAYRAAAPTPNAFAVSVSATSLALPATTVGSVSSASALTVSNPGTAALALQNIALSDTQNFRLASACGSSIPAGGQCSLSVVFQPQSVATLAATLTLAINTANSVSVTLTGSGVGLPKPRLSLASLSFPATALGATAPVQTVALTNVGSAALTNVAALLTGTGAPAFQQSNNCAGTLAPGASCSYSIAFSPSATGAFNSALAVTADGISVPLAVALAGTGETVFQAALQTCKTQPLNVFILGDSRSIVDVTTFPNGSGVGILSDPNGTRWVDLLQQKLTALCGSHGSGLIPFRWAGGYNSFNNDYYSQASGWTTDPAIGPAQGGRIADAFSVVVPSGTSINFHPPNVYDTLRMYCAVGPGLNPWSLYIDGIQQGTCGGAAATLAASVGTTSTVAIGAHSAIARCDVGPCEGFGMEAVAGTAGASVHNLSIGACTAECFGSNPTQQLAYSDLIPGGPQLVIGALITNEPGVGYNTVSFNASLIAMIRHEAAQAGTPTTLLYAPLQANLAGLADYYPVIAHAAIKTSSLYFDMRSVYGDAYIAAMFGPDGVHESSVGHAAVFNEVSNNIF